MNSVQLSKQFNYTFIVIRSMGPFDNEHTPLQLQGTGEMNIACFSSKRKRSIDEKDTVFPRGHCAGPDFEWVYVSRDRSGITGKRSF